MQCMPRSFQASKVCDVPTVPPPPPVVVVTVTGMLIVVLLSFRVIWAVPAAFAVTVTLEPDTTAVAIVVLEEVAVSVPETLETVIAPVAPVSRPSEVGLAAITEVALTVTGMLSVVLLSFRVIWTEPALFAVTVALEPDTETVATEVLEELAVRLPEALDSVITEVAPTARFSDAGLAVIADAAKTVIGMLSVVLLSLAIIRAVPIALAMTLIFPLERLAVAIFESLVVTFIEPETLLSTTVAVAFLTSVNAVGEAVRTAFALLPSDFSRSANAGWERNTSGAISTANPLINRLYVMTTS